jgi:hypothetical protein
VKLAGEELADFACRRQCQHAYRRADASNKSGSMIWIGCEPLIAKGRTNACIPVAPVIKIDMFATVLFWCAAADETSTAHMLSIDLRDGSVGWSRGCPMSQPVRCSNRSPRTFNAALQLHDSTTSSSSWSMSAIGVLPKCNLGFVWSSQTKGSVTRGSTSTAKLFLASLMRWCLHWFLTSASEQLCTWRFRA